MASFLTNEVLISKDEPEMFLKKYAKNVHSQHGEDGIIEEIFKRLKIKDEPNSWAVEFGAWDGKYLNNAFYLAEKKWSCVMIEGDNEKFKDLLKTSEEYKNIIPINAWVAQTSDKENSLFNLLKTTSIPEDFDLLSIDVDSYDSDIWDSFEGYNPKVVVIEINSTPRPGIKWRHCIYDLEGKPIVVENARGQGTTFSAMLDVAHDKQYTLVCHTGNGIFVRNDLLSHIDMPQDYIDNQDLLYWGP